MKAVLSSEILRPKGGRELLKSWGVEEWTLRAALEWSCVALLHLNWKALRIFTTSNCDCLKMLASPLLITCMYLLCNFYVCIFIFNRPSSFIATIIFPLEKIRYTQRMNITHRRKTVAHRRKTLREEKSLIVIGNGPCSATLKTCMAWSSYV